MATRLKISHRVISKISQQVIFDDITTSNFYRYHNELEPTRGNQRCACRSSSLWHRPAEGYRATGVATGVLLPSSARPELVAVASRSRTGPAVAPATAVASSISSPSCSPGPGSLAVSLGCMDLTRRIKTSFLSYLLDQ